MCFVVNKFLHLFQVLRNFQNTATAINAPPSPLLVYCTQIFKGEIYVYKRSMIEDLCSTTNPPSYPSFAEYGKFSKTVDHALL